MKLRDRICCFVLLLGLAGPWVAAYAQSSVLVLSSRDNAAYREVEASFKAHLENQLPNPNIISVRLNPGDMSGPQDEQLEGIEPELIFALGTPAAEWASEAFRQVPMVATMVLSRQALEALPNTTGIALEFQPATQLEWMRRLLPNVKRIGVLYDPSQNQPWIDLASREARKLGLNLVPIAVRDPRELPAGLRALDREADVLWALPDRTVYSNKTLRQVLLSSFHSKIPLVGLSNAWVEAGAIYALDRDYAALGQQSGAMAIRVLSGEAADRLQPETPRQPVYSLNLKTVRHMKMEMARKVIDGAVKVYE